jgi:ABC-type glycerol-3-phosphate transport system substrate-binding protein
MRLRPGVAVTAAVTLCAALAGCGDSGGSSSGATEITVWEGWVGVEGRAFAALVSQFEASHSGISVHTLQTNQDYALQKVSTAVRGGEPPDISYLYGSWAPNIATVPSLVDLTSTVKQKSVNWNDFYPGEQKVATVDGKVVGMPALVDNLAIVYNKKLFADAGVSPPTPDWTWDDFRAAAKALTDPGTKQYGWTMPANDSEDTVWHWEAMLWEAGGDILNSDNTKAVFNSPEGVQAMTTLQEMAVDDKSVYLDTTNSTYSQLFNAGKIGMVVTGPWDLSGFHVKYGVQIMPSYAGSAAGHVTIAGPDNWVVFDNGDAEREAALTFLTWLTAPEQVKAWSLRTGDLPTRRSVGEDTGLVDKMDAKLPGIKTFVDNLANVEKARPQVPAYPKISLALSDAIVSVMLGKDDPQSALDKAAQIADQALAEG